MEFWDIYDEDKKLTGRTMKRNDWNMKEGDFHLTVLGAVKRKDGKYLILVFIGLLRMAVIKINLSNST